jgi:hypothetical protein
MTVKKGGDIFTPVDKIIKTEYQPFIMDRCCIKLAFGKGTAYKVVCKIVCFQCFPFA